MKNPLILLVSIVTVLFSCQKNEILIISSPGETNSIEFSLNNEGAPVYRVKHHEHIMVDYSKMGFDLEKSPDLTKGLEIIEVETNEFQESWALPWGEQLTVDNHYNEKIITLKEKEEPNRKLRIYFRSFDDGVAFRYEFLPQLDLDSLYVLDENTEFKLTGDHKCWWIPGDWDIYEHLYTTSFLSEIDAIKYRQNNNLAQSYIPENAVNTPLTMKTKEGIYLSFHEANLTDYSGMTLKLGEDKLSLISGLVGSERTNYKVKRALPFKTPWRTIQIAEKAGDLIESKLILNLNEPSKIEDISYFKPKKYVGIWWEMHIGVASWDYGTKQEGEDQFLVPHGRHGATTENAKKYIDFASENDITGVLVEGWNTGWEHWIGFEDREGVFDFITPYPDYNLEEVVSYANEKGVEIIMHHETSAAPRTYEQQLDTAFQLMQKHGIHAVKTGYVGKIIPKGEYHHGQWMVQHYRRVLEQGAKYAVAINAHEPIKATGLRRTYPNAIAREGLRGQEFNAWGAFGGNPPEHISIVAFTRMLSGPIDFTPGVFDIAIPSKETNQVNTTLAHQLASYVVIYSPIQMACDLPKNYEDKDAFQFIREVGVDWEKSIVLNGEIGDFVTIARKEKDTGNWFIGGITDENKREMTVPFDFLNPDTKYIAHIYKDGSEAHYKENPLDIDIIKIEITNESNLDIGLAEGGGFALSIFPIE